MEERIQFIQDALSDRFAMAELCARYGVSRRIGYKWLARYEEEGRRGLKDRSRAPHNCSHRIDDELAEIICAFRREHPFWGARKLLRVLADRHPRVTQWPAASTTADLLARRVLLDTSVTYLPGCSVAQRRLSAALITASRSPRRHAA